MRMELLNQLRQFLKVTGTIDSNGQLTLDRPLLEDKYDRACVIAPRQRDSINNHVTRSKTFAVPTSNLQGTLRSFTFTVHSSEFAKCRGEVESSRNHY